MLPDQWDIVDVDFGNPIGHEQAYEESLQGALVVCLVPARTDAAWFHDWILDKAEIRFHRRRIVFRGSRGIDQTKRPQDGTMFAIYHPAKAL